MLHHIFLDYANLQANVLKFKFEINSTLTMKIHEPPCGRRYDNHV